MFLIFAGLLFFTYRQKLARHLLQRWNGIFVNGNRKFVLVRVKALYIPGIHHHCHRPTQARSLQQRSDSVVATPPLQSYFPPSNLPVKLWAEMELLHQQIISGRTLEKYKQINNISFILLYNYYINMVVIIIIPIMNVVVGIIH